MAAQHLLLVENGPSAGTHLLLTAETTTEIAIGQNARVQWPRVDTHVRAAATVRVEQNSVHIAELPGQGTISINGTIVREGPLRVGQQLRIGATLFRLLEAPSDNLSEPEITVEEPAPSPPTAAPAPVVETAPTTPAATTPAAPAPIDPSMVPIPIAPSGTKEFYPFPVVRTPPAAGTSACDGCGTAGPGPDTEDFKGALWLCSKCIAGRRALPEDIPQHLGDFELLRELGRGAMAYVFEAVHVVHGARAAIKVLHPIPPPSAELLERFLREQRIISSLRHPHITRCYRVGARGDWLYIAQEFVPGGDASRLISPESSLGPVLLAGADLFDALSHAHDNSVVHRDVKPQNLLLTRPNKNGHSRGKLADFGLAKAFTAANRPITRLGQAGGSMLMMAPEQLLKFSTVGPAGDLYSAAATVYRLLTGDTHLVLPCAFTVADTAQIAEAIVSAARVPLRARRSDVPMELTLLIDMLVAHDPVHRETMSAAHVASQFARWADFFGAPREAL